jgi:hypothetical protein
MRTRTATLLAALWAIGAPASAQTDDMTRAAAPTTARAVKAATPARYTPGRIERIVTMVETNGVMQRMFTPRDGVGVRIGGIDRGSPVAMGPSWRMSTLARGTVHAHATAAVSIARDTDVVAGVAFPHLGHHVAVSVGGGATHLANERFFGLGGNSRRAEETSFAWDSRYVTGTLSVTGPAGLTVTAAASTMTATTADGGSRRVPAISSRFTTRDAPGLRVEAPFAVASLATAIDYRDVPLNPRSGGRYYIAVSRHADMRQQDAMHSFTRVDVELEQHLSGWKRQRVITLRALGSSAIADRGHEVPFYLQPTLGGSRVLRGFVTDRFRDRTLLALQAEYGWDVSPFLNAVAFYEAGTVAAAVADLQLSNFRRTYGLGFRFGSARTVAFRTDVALGSGEGTRLIVRLNHAF